MKSLSFGLLISITIHILLLLYFSKNTVSNYTVLADKESVVMVSIMQSSKGVVTDTESINRDNKNQESKKAEKKRKQIENNDYGKEIKKKEQKNQAVKNAKKGGYSHSESSNFQQGYADYVPAPKYPLISRRNKEEGTAVFNLVIDSEGRLKKYTLIKSSGYKRLDMEAEKSVKNSKFHAAVKNGKNVESSIELKITFNLQGE